MGGSIIRVLVVDDYEPWRHWLRATLLADRRFHVIGEESDGLGAVRKALELQPDLVLLDIGLPKLNGIEAARRIRELSPGSKIILVSENRSWDIVEEGLRTGASGYVLKSNTARELLPAVEAVLGDKHFVTAGLAPPNLKNAEEWKSVNTHHQVGFYSEDWGLLGALTQFIGAALNAGNAAIVFATESHRRGLLIRLQKSGLNVVAAIEQRKYVALDAAGALSTVMVDGQLDTVRFFDVFDQLIAKPVEATSGGQNRITIFGECAQLLWAKGMAEAMILMEKLVNQLTKKYDVDIFCGYSLTGFQSGLGSQIFEKVRAEHSAVHAW